MPLLFRASITGLESSNALAYQGEKELDVKSQDYVRMNSQEMVRVKQFLHQAIINQITKVCKKDLI